MRILRSALFIVSFACISPYLGAQPGVGDPTEGNPTPITGIEILLALGGMFGVKKILNYRKKK